MFYYLYIYYCINILIFSITNRNLKLNDQFDEVKYNVYYVGI